MKSICIGLMLISASPAFAGGSVNKVPDNWNCWQSASKTYDIPVALLKGIAKQESGFNAYAININKNGTYDLGLMQINSTWLKKGSELYKAGVTKADLLGNACLNLYVGAWVLRGNINKLGYNWRAVGAYNARTESKRIKYAHSVLRHVKTIEAQKAGG